jgi:hypothetical protein
MTCSRPVPTGRLPRALSVLLLSSADFCTPHVGKVESARRDSTELQLPIATGPSNSLRTYELKSFLLETHGTVTVGLVESLA